MSDVAEVLGVPADGLVVPSELHVCKMMGGEGSR